MSTTAIATTGPNLSPTRIFAIAVALVLHIAALALLLAPVRRPDPAAFAPPPPIEVVMQERVIPPPPAPPMVPITPPRPVPVRDRRHSTQPVVTPHLEPAISLDDVVPPITPPDAVIDTGRPVVDDDAFRAEQIGNASYLEAPPPRYPPLAKKRDQEGDVFLLVTIGADGRPEAVALHASSGFALLDRAAIEQVQRRWRFRPLLVGGLPTRSRAIVPIRFSLVRG